MVAQRPAISPGSEFGRHGSKFDQRQQALGASAASRPQYYDLREALAQSNQKTRCYLHYCGAYARDQVAAERMSGVPGVKLCPYHCNHHFVVTLMMQGHLREIFQRPGAGDATSG